MKKCALIVVAAIGFGCIPSRDNPNDPSVAPVAKLTVSPSDGTQHTVFTLDASGSSGKGTLRYCWDLDGDPSTFEKPCAAAALTTAMLAIPAGALGPAGEGTFTLHVHVKVEDDRGRSLVEAPVLIHNARPVVDAGAEIITAFGTASTVELDGCAATTTSACASFDPDGDDVAWDWKQVGGVEPVTITYPTADHRRAQFTAPATPQVLYFELTGDDGAAIARSRTTVRVGTPAWVTAVSPTRLLRIHSEATSFPLPDTLTAIEALSTDESGDVWLERSPSFGTHDAVHLSPSGTVLDRYSLPEYAYPVLARTGGACAYLPTAGELAILRPAASGTAGAFVPISLTDISPAQLLGILPDATDPAACIAVGLSKAERVRVDGSQSLLDLGSQPVISQDSLMTADGALWTAVVINGKTHVTRIDSSGAKTDYVSDVGGQFTDGFLTAVDGESVVMLNRTPDGTANIGFRASPREFAQISVPPVVLEFGQGVIGLPQTGDVFLHGVTDGLIQRFALRGNSLELETTATETEIAFDPAAPITALAPDPWIGGVLALNGSTLLRVPGSLHPVETVSPASSNYTHALEPANGSVWTGEGLPGVTMRLDGSGRAAAAIPTPTGAGNPSQSYGLPDGGVRIIRFDANELQSFDRHGVPTGTIPVVSPLFLYQLGQDASGAARCGAGVDGNNQGAIARITGQTMTTLATGLPVASCTTTPTGNSWFATSGTELRFDDGMTVATHAIPFTLGATNVGETSMVADPRDDTLWAEDSGNTLHHLATSGASLGSFAIAAGPFALSKRCASTSDPSCLEVWVASTANVVRYRADGTEVARYALPPGLTPNDIDVAP